MVELKQDFKEFEWVSGRDESLSDHLLRDW
jgi:hypothetical protein